MIEDYRKSWSFMPPKILMYNSSNFNPRHQNSKILGQLFMRTAWRLPSDIQTICWMPTSFYHFDITPSMNGNQEFTKPRSIMSLAGPSHWYVCSWWRDLVSMIKISLKILWRKHLKYGTSHTPSHQHYMPSTIFPLLLTQHSPVTKYSTQELLF
jgi:hypothetical protein